MTDAKAKDAKPQPLAESEFNKPWEREDQYEFVRKSNDPRFGEVNVYKQMWNNEIVFVKEKNTSSKADAEKDILELKKRTALNYPHLLRLGNYSTSIKKELCSTHYITKGIYDFPHSDVQKELNERKKNNQTLSHNELGHLAYQILHALLHLHSHGLTHGDVRPIYIGYNRATNNYHLLDRLIDISPVDKLQANNIINKKELFLSPQLYAKLQGKDKNAKFSANKNDLFALGLAILVAGNGSPINDIYLPQGEFSKEKLANHIAHFEQRFIGYNANLVQITKWLLQFNEEDRPEAQDLLSRVQSYDDYKRQDIYAVGGYSHVVQAVPSEIIQISPTETHVVQGVETKVSYGQPVVRTYVYTSPPPGFNVNEATSYINYSEYKPSENKLEKTDEPINTENKEVTYIHESNPPPVNPNIVYSYAPAPVPTYIQAPTTSYVQPLTTYVQATPYTTQTFEPIVRRSINREARTEPQTIVTRYVINEKGEVVENHMTNK